MDSGVLLVLGVVAITIAALAGTSNDESLAAMRTRLPVPVREPFRRIVTRRVTIVIAAVFGAAGAALLLVGLL